MGDLITKKIRFIVVFFIALIVSGCHIAAENQKETLSLNDSINEQYGSDQYVKIYLHNNTSHSLVAEKTDLPWGSWIERPSSSIPAYSHDSFASKGKIFSGTDGEVIYRLPNGEGKLNVYWSLSHWGSQNHNIHLSEGPDKYKLEKVIKGSYPGITIDIYLTEKNIGSNYKIAVMSDPQPWRLDPERGDPNADKKPWEELNRKVANSINNIYEKNHLAFGIVNGDLTEFGRASTRRSLDEVYTSKIKFPLFMGLGNHDYANNVNDCTYPENLDFSRNACARSAVFDMAEKISDYSKKLNNFSYDYDDEAWKGSLSYSWDFGDIHYVQLQNYPTYSVDLDHYISPTVYITKSLDWLESDLKSAQKRGKAVVLNFHDGYDHFIDNSSSAEKEKFRSLIEKYNVMAAFVGHSHFLREYTSYVFVSARVYDSGALFQGDFFIINVNKKCMQISAYNGINGIPKFVKKMTSVCGK
ncbi:metallophosphoesterase [Photorhabdus sp. CRCIA-P01]|uniref:metallophosphoesterase n=1 Tax=Photorhabdus sp. CRCIA-P01 TaxID=2019570 RepID=UPI000E599714|nr:metallophosphoesterase [Photorhabdus sp. CRCIA-P01]